MMLEEAFENVVQSRTFDVRHRKILEIVKFARGMNRHNVRLVQLGQHFLLAKESLAGSGWGSAAPDCLHGHTTFEGMLNRLIYLPQAPSADGPTNLEVAETLGHPKCGFRVGMADGAPGPNQIQNSRFKVRM